MIIRGIIFISFNPSLWAVMAEWLRWWIRTLQTCIWIPMSPLWDIDGVVNDTVTLLKDLFETLKAEFTILKCFVLFQAFYLTKYKNANLSFSFTLHHLHLTILFSERYGAVSFSFIIGLNYNIFTFPGVQNFWVTFTFSEVFYHINSKKSADI